MTYERGPKRATARETSVGIVLALSVATQQEDAMSAATQPASFQSNATQAFLVVRLTEAYGLPVTRVKALDAAALICVAATLDFLSNNLPAACEPKWVDAVVP
jgi:hypothetical protein